MLLNDFATSTTEAKEPGIDEVARRTLHDLNDTLQSATVEKVVRIKKLHELAP
jgi:hypothetical protein